MKNVFFLFVNLIRQVLFCHMNFQIGDEFIFFKFKLLYWKWDHLRNAIFITRIKVVEVYKYTGKRFQLSISGSNFQKKKTPTDIHGCICNTLKREGYTNITLRTFTQVNDVAYYIDITFLFKDKKQRIVRSENAGFTEEVNLLEIIET